MTPREKILKATLENQPALVALPTVDWAALLTYEDVVAQFEAMLTKIGGNVIRFSAIETLQAHIQLHAPDEVVINTLDASGEQRMQLAALRSFELENVHTAYVRGALGVAENGAVWVDEKAMINRVLPFICQHLVLVLRADQIIATMHHAYQQIDVATTGFGAFIAGPSKTADIEQSLVIGAHGPRSLTLFLQVPDQDKR
ncbi:LutC/YkgG family protein [Pedobacter immunditicola]|uniref:LutC/YkgG family protein n=1 Tax=Pedobacter immunditicola TaxID=3133440 RepID=UPI00309554FB